MRSQNLSFCRTDLIIKEAFTGGLFYMADPQTTTMIPCSLLCSLLYPHAYCPPTSTMHSTQLCWTLLCSNSKSVPVEAERQRRVAGLLNTTIPSSAVPLIPLLRLQQSNNAFEQFCNNPTAMLLNSSRPVEWHRRGQTSDKTHLQPQLFLFVQKICLQPAFYWSWNISGRWIFF